MILLVDQPLPRPELDLTVPLAPVLQFDTARMNPELTLSPWVLPHGVTYEPVSIPRANMARIGILLAAMGGALFGGYRLMVREPPGTVPSFRREDSAERHSLEAYHEGPTTKVGPTPETSEEGEPFERAPTDISERPGSEYTAQTVQPCQIAVGPHSVHFSVHQRQSGGEVTEEYCNTIPAQGPTTVVLDYDGKLLSDMTVELEFLKVPGGRQIYYQPPSTYRTGYVIAIIDFPEPGSYLARLTFLSKNQKVHGNIDLTVGAVSATMSDLKKTASGEEARGSRKSYWGDRNTTHPAAIESPSLRVGDTYVMESINHANPKLNNITERRVVSIEANGDFVLSSSNRKSGYTRIITYTGQWNVKRATAASGDGLEYSPPISYYDFPLVTGKRWKRTCIERNTRTGATREHTIAGIVGDWESVSVPAGTFRGLRITLETQLLDRATGKVAYGEDISWYVPEIKRSVKSEVFSKDPGTGQTGHQTMQLLSYQLQ